jgi:4-diphosphocytidyl-2-C-methyl-D-erythritol kinase
MSKPHPPDTLVVEAPAKVNPFLRVLRARGDGFHEVETLILPISLADRLEIHASSDPSQFRTLSFTFEVSGERDLVQRVPSDESNLVLRAARALAEEAGVKGFADIILEKKVPAAAGLGGGSSDAAAALRALNDLWGCGLNDDELRSVGARVGSDVPALLAGGPVLARGRGEVVEPVRVSPMRWVLATFAFGVRTADAYRWWDADGAGSGPEPSRLLEAAGSGDSETLGPLLFNDLEGPVASRHPEVEAAKRRLLDAGALGAVMSGSGPTVAGLFPSGSEPDLEGTLRVRSP